MGTGQVMPTPGATGRITRQRGAAPQGMDMAGLPRMLDPQATHG